MPNSDHRHMRVLDALTPEDVAVIKAAAKAVNKIAREIMNHDNCMGQGTSCDIYDPDHMRQIMSVVKQLDIIASVAEEGDAPDAPMSTEDVPEYIKNIMNELGIEIDRVGQTPDGSTFLEGRGNFNFLRRSKPSTGRKHDA